MENPLKIISSSRRINERTNPVAPIITAILRNCLQRGMYFSDISAKGVKKLNNRKKRRKVANFEHLFTFGDDRSKVFQNRSRTLASTFTRKKMKRNPADITTKDITTNWSEKIIVDTTLPGIGIVRTRNNIICQKK
jgi:hypothetical protein